MPPKDGFLKINTDASYVPGEVQASCGVAVRDHNGELVAASAGRDAGVTDAYHEELQAMIRAVEIAVDLGAIRVVLKTDSQLLALALNRRGPDFSQLATRLDDLKIQLRAWFSCSKVKACRCEELPMN
jgi:ribonuclease HI